MVGRAVVYHLDCCTLVYCNATVSLDFLDHRLDGTINGGGPWLFTHGSRHRAVGGALVLHWHSAISGRANSYTPLPGLILPM
jgi:hypothetical protein